MIKTVDGVEVKPKHKATCHCGKVELELTLPDGLVIPGAATARCAGARARWWLRYRWTAFAS